MSSTFVSVGDLVDALSAWDRGVPVRLAINPFYPMAHRVGEVVAACDADDLVVYLAEDPAGEQDILPPSAAVALAWHPSPSAPERRRRATTASRWDDLSA
ncbi:hypothetical protein ACL02R_17135 [Streptomyces sp. MS19]|uniref:hypothetical protein n=1 Tax=Streptomyces sp. MS19 TaxID=3385972 RepID=UPI0039A0AEB7